MPILLLLFEAALAVYRIRQGKMQYKAAALVRGFAALLIIVLAAFSVITWGLRYYALVIVLVISAAVNATMAWRGKNEKIKRAGILLKSAVMWVLLLFAILPVILFPEYTPLPTTGEYGVKTATRHLVDESRTEPYSDESGRALTVEFWYPESDTGGFPLIVFSHGGFGTRKSNESLYRELASNGYVVCSVDHTYHCLYTTDSSGKLRLINGEYLKELSRENAKENKQGSLELYRKWMDVRTRDIDFVIDVVKSDPADEIYSLADSEKIGVMGHSLGGAAALGVGRKNPAVSAVIALESPFMCDILDVRDGEFVFESEDYPAPLLNVYSDSSWENLSSWPQYYENAKLISKPDKDTHNVHIEGVGHLSLTDLSLASPVLTRILDRQASSVKAKDCLERINAECLKFFDCYLKGITKTKKQETRHAFYK